MGWSTTGSGERPSEDGPSTRRLPHCTTTHDSVSRLPVPPFRRVVYCSQQNQPKIRTHERTNQGMAENTERLAPQYPNRPPQRLTLSPLAPPRTKSALATLPNNHARPQETAITHATAPPRQAQADRRRTAFTKRTSKSRPTPNSPVCAKPPV